MRLKLLPNQENVPLEDKLCGDYELVSETDGFNGRTVNRNVLINTVSINLLDEEIRQAEINMQTLSLIHISEPTRRHHVSRMPSSA